MSEQVHTNYRLLLPDEEVPGTVVVADGRIHDVQPGTAQRGKNSGGTDGGGAYLLPGLVELHTDNLERCIMPRPGVNWPLASAVAIHDSQLVAAGITSVFDALSVGDVNPASVRLKQLTPTIEAVSQAQRGGWLAADHRIHLRFELSFEDGVAIAEEHLGNPLVGLVSLMDHSPGQRQFTDPEKLDQYLAGKYGLSPEAVRALVEEIQRKQELYGDANRAALARLARERGLPIASHDDATAEHVAEAERDGVTLAEFPTTVEAARAAHERGMRVVAGAPNLMLGGSHSGNVSTAELGAAELVDILSSDYVPLSLLHGVFRLAAETGRPLHQAARTATLHAAQAVGMNDRGALAPGLRADLIAVHEAGGVPRLQSVWIEGRRVV